MNNQQIYFFLQLVVKIFIVLQFLLIKYFILTNICLQIANINGLALSKPQDQSQHNHNCNFNNFENILIVMKQSKRNFHTHSSLQNHKKLHKKISQHIKQITQKSHQSLKTQNPLNKKPQNIAQNIIQKNKHKYLYKKALINTKFQWLNKYLQNSELKPLSVNLNNNNNKISYSYLKDRQGRTSALSRKNIQFDSNNGLVDWKNNRRTKTENVVEDFYQEGEIQQYVLLKKNKEDRKYHQNECFDNSNFQVNPNQSYDLLRQINVNSKILSEKYSNKLIKSKSSKENCHHRVLISRDDKNLERILSKQRKKNFSEARKYSMSKILTSEAELNQKQNENRVGVNNNLRVKKIFVQQNNPHYQNMILENSSRLKSNNTMIGNASGCIKNRKKQYLFQSRQSKRQHSQFLKRKRRFEQQVNIQPWNFNGNNAQNQQNCQFTMFNNR